jgi:hypothetical protein
MKAEIVNFHALELDEIIQHELEIDNPIIIWNQ